jgi:steroid Delta-isomerase
MTTPCERYRAYLETLTPETLARLPEYVIGGVRFKDPFNDVTGADAMARVLRHMFGTVGDIRFTVQHALTGGDYCLMAWRFQGTLRGQPWQFDGASVIRFAPDGRVAEHVDHWDAASSFYQRLPVIGSLLSWVRGWLIVGRQRRRTPPPDRRVW